MHTTQMHLKFLNMLKLKIMSTGDCRLRKSQKPLADKRFYLDLKNHGASIKVETRLKSLGAVSNHISVKL